MPELVSKYSLNRAAGFLLNGDPEEPQERPDIEPEKPPEEPTNIPVPEKEPFSPDEPEQLPPLPIPEHPSPGPSDPDRPAM
ncbi:chitin-binding protein [Brucella sp. BE17]|uniref:chitin-binding protein n=1 Tax=Brucella sp. BE17 TaxID=3142977 RepID=UPI0031BAB6CE